MYVCTATNYIKEQTKYEKKLSWSSNPENVLEKAELCIILALKQLKILTRDIKE